MRSVRSLFLRMWNGVASYNRRLIERCNRGGSVADARAFAPPDIERMTADQASETASSFPGAKVGGIPRQRPPPLPIDASTARRSEE